MIKSLLIFLFILGGVCYIQYKLTTVKPVFLRCILPAITFILSIVLCIGLSDIMNPHNYELITSDGITRSFHSEGELFEMAQTLEESGLEYNAKSSSPSMLTLSTKGLIILFSGINIITVLLLFITFLTVRTNRNRN